MFKPTGYSETIFKDRYAFTEDEPWAGDNGACMRVAKQMAIAEKPDKYEKYIKKFYKILVNNYFCPGGRIWYGSGRPNPKLLNCFVLGNDLDSKEGWGRIIYENVVTSMSGGGCGQDFSSVRPRNAEIHGQRGVCPGIVELAKGVNGGARMVRSGGGRRSANMYSLKLNHPDLMEFLDAKLIKGELDMGNISVNSFETEKFIEAVKNDGYWELSWKGRYNKKIKARPLWNKIVKNAYDSAEPGFLNMELALSESTVYYIEGLVTTNPCFTGDMLLKTKNGFISFRELSNHCDLQLYNKNHEIVRGRVWSNGVKKTVNVKLTNKEIIKCTHDHRFMINNGEERMAKDLKGLRLMPSYTINDIEDKFVKLGFIQGDGCLGRIASKTHKGMEVNIGYKDGDIAKLFKIQHDLDEKKYYLNGFNDICLKLGFDASPLFNRQMPSTYLSWRIKEKSSFLRGMYSANGSVIKNKRIAYKSTSAGLIEILKGSLLKDFGIDSYVTTNKAKDIKFKNGTYKCKESYDLNIGQFTNIVKFAKLIGFVHDYKNKSLEEVILNKAPMVMSVKNAKMEEVFDFNLEDTTHWGVVSKNGDNGYIVHNCGEIYMTAYESCDLGHLVLPRFVKNNQVDMHQLAEVTRLGVRLLDNVLSINNYPLPEMKEKAAKMRRIGLGTTGLADMLAMLGYKYGSEEGNKFIDKLYRHIAKAAYEASVMLAVEKGPFPECKPELHVKSGYMKRMSKKIRALVEEHGIRNCALLTQAPTGTTSILSGNCSSGIEPIFAFAYWRNYWNGDNRARELCFHPLFIEFMEANKNIDHFVVSHDLTVRDHMEVQKIIQKHVDNAVSKTINIPNKYPIKKMSELWLEYLPHLKGTTFYREGSRNFVDANGQELEPPLVPIPIKEALKLYKEQREVKVEAIHVDDCTSGICEIKD